MESTNSIELLDCPLCQGPSLLEEENGWCFYAMCLDCGCQTAEIEYKTPEARLDAAKQAAHLWNMGKVIPCSPGE